jgi:hypothetical protein
VIKHLNNINFPLRIDCLGEIANGSHNLGPIPQLMESFLHVVTETCFWDNRTHLTEKIFKPIIAKQPFVLLGCANNLQYLKSYGFKTFDAWWNESYDQIQDPIQRLNFVVNIIDDICSKSNSELQEMLVDMQQVLNHNFNLFYDRKFVNSIWKELTDSLQQAVSQLKLPIFQEKSNRPSLCSFP